MVKHSKRIGFTLIEILVVMLIIGIASGLIVINAGHFLAINRNSQEVATELQSLLKLLRYQAVFALNTYAVNVDRHTYSFMVYDVKAAQWQPLVKVNAFWKTRRLDSTLWLAAEPAHIEFYPSGEITPFTIRVQGENSQTRYKISGTFAGNITMVVQHD